MKVLVLCASEQSYQNNRAEILLDRLHLLGRNTELYYVGPMLESGPNRCADIVSRCLDAFGRKKFDLILNEYCPVNAASLSMTEEIVEALVRLAKKRAYFITPIIQRAPQRSDVLIWEEFMPPLVNGERIAWNDLLHDLGFRVVDFVVHNTIVIFRR